MKVLFHNNQLDNRGTMVAVADYARYNQEILGNESIICYDATTRSDGYQGTDPGVLERLESEFQIIGHQGVNDLQTIIDREKVDFAYFLRSGNIDFLPNNCSTGVHSVFQNYQPHGDKYAYVSEWLASTMAQRNGLPSLSWVPHIVNLPEPNGNYREELGIRQDQFVFGRHGGRYTFDLQFVKKAIADLISTTDKFVFLFVGTEPWIDHPNVKFFNEIQNLQDKANVIDTWDAMIHARIDGESFGLAFTEALSLNKPVLSWEGGSDLHHTKVLENSGLLYNENTILDKLTNIQELAKSEDWTKRVEQFKPEVVMQQFNNVFLK
jgi:glycosyltransferase involved in cell wall biosynthesis